MSLRMIITYIKRGFAILSDPRKEFEEIDNHTLEEIAAYYMVMLVLVAIAAGLVSFLFSIIKTAYFDLTLNLDVNYLRMINYSLGMSTSVTFFYIFAGTFLVFIASVVLKFLFPRIVYTVLLKILLYSLSPLLVFGWIPYSPFALVVWSGFLFISATKSYKPKAIKKTSISQRY